MLMARSIGPSGVGRLVGNDVTGDIVGCAVVGRRVGSFVGDEVGAELVGLVVGPLVAGLAVGDLVTTIGDLVGVGVGDRDVGVELDGMEVGEMVVDMVVVALTAARLNRRTSSSYSPHCMYSISSSLRSRTPWLQIDIMSLRKPTNIRQCALELPPTKTRPVQVNASEPNGLTVVAVVVTVLVAVLVAVVGTGVVPVVVAVLVAEV